MTDSNLPTRDALLPGDAKHRLATKGSTPVDSVSVGRESSKIREFEREVNELCRRLGEPPRYACELDPEAISAPDELAIVPSRKNGVSPQPALGIEMSSQRPARLPDHTSKTRRLWVNLADVALRESEAFNRSIIESSPDCIKVLDLDGNLLSMLRGQNLLGIEDIRPYLNTRWSELWNGDDRVAARAAVDVAVAGGQGRFVGFFRTVAGDPKWWDVSIAPILDPNDEPIRLLVVSRDVTQRRQAEMNLGFLASISQDLVHSACVADMMRAVGAKMAAHLELSLCAFVEIDEAADKVVIAHDWHRDDAAGLTGTHRLQDFLGAELIRTARAGLPIVVTDTAKDVRTDAATFAAMKVASFICVPLIRDGKWRFAGCLYRSIPSNWRDDEVTVAVEATARIGTRLERLRAEEDLRRSESRYRTLFESIDEGFCILEKTAIPRSGPIDFRVVEANPAFEMQSGVSDVVGRNLRQKFPGASESWYVTFESVLQTGEPIRFEHELSANGRVLEAYIFRVEHHTADRLAVVFKDITERKLTEESLRQRTGQFHFHSPQWGAFRLSLTVLVHYRSITSI